MHERFLHHCPACGGDVPECIEHILLECPRWECHQRNFETLAPKFNGLVGQFATSSEDISALLLGGVPLPFMAPFILQGMGGFSSYGAKPTLILLSLYFSSCIALPKCFAP
jgi:hypothetical protein